MMKNPDETGIIKVYGDSQYWDEPQQPLRRLKVKNFKAISKVELALKPMTVVVGKNSSGKSTLIQAILAMAQNASNRSVNGVFDFNGKYKELGKFGQLQNKYAANQVAQKHQRAREWIEDYMVSCLEVQEGHGAENTQMNLLESMPEEIKSSFVFSSDPTHVVIGDEVVPLDVALHDITTSTLQEVKQENDIWFGADIRLHLPVEFYYRWFSDTPEKTNKVLLKSNVAWSTRIGLDKPEQVLFLNNTDTTKFSNAGQRARILESSVHVTANNPELTIENTNKKNPVDFLVPGGLPRVDHSKFFESRLDIKFTATGRDYLENDWTGFHFARSNPYAAMDFDFESYAVGDAQFTGRDLGDWYDPESLPEGHPRRSFIKNFKRNFICAGPFDAGLPSDLLHVCTGLEGAVRDLAAECLAQREGNSRTVDRILDQIERVVVDNAWQEDQLALRSGPIEIEIQDLDYSLRSLEEELAHTADLRDGIEEMPNQDNLDPISGEVEYEIDYFDQKIDFLQSEIDVKSSLLEERRQQLNEVMQRVEEDKENRKDENADLNRLMKLKTIYKSSRDSYRSNLPAIEVDADREFVELAKKYVPSLRNYERLDESLIYLSNLYGESDGTDQDFVMRGLDLAEDILGNFSQNWSEEELERSERTGWKLFPDNSGKLNDLCETVLRLGVNKFTEEILLRFSSYMKDSEGEDLNDLYEFADWYREFWDYDEQKTYVDTVLTATNQIAEFFRTNIKYLGPIREPQGRRGHSVTDIGKVGENAAWVLENLSDVKGRHIVPIGSWKASQISHSESRKLNYQIHGGSTKSDGSFGFGDSPKTIETEVPLGDALSMWLQWFGLASDLYVEPGEYGETGVFVTDIEGVTSRIDNVGVGVSQAYPVILQCLLSRRRDVLIFEQPELHLHPALEKKMGTFLLEFTKAGRQIIVETHSSHLVNSLRSAAAQDPSDQVPDHVQLLFAQKNTSATESNQILETDYVISDINRYGGLSEEWPEGFLDESSKLSSELVNAGLAKKKRELEGKHNSSNI